MNRDEFNRLLLGAANPDTAAESLAAISEAITAVFDERDAAAAARDELTGQVSQLRDANIRLFLKIQGEPEPEKDEEAEKIIAIDKEIAEKFGG